MHVAAQPSDGSTAVIVGGTRITHPARVMFPDEGITKGEFARFVADVAEWMLPHVAGRPLSLVRCPDGLDEDATRTGCFFQKHAHVGTPVGIRRVRVREASGMATYLAVDDLAGLVTLVQFGTLEVHPWGARADAPDTPDRMFFDLDPGPGLDWKAVVDAAEHVRETLATFGLESFVKTSGGKGLHVVVPLTTGSATWDTVKRFSHAVANRLGRMAPERYVATMSKELRTGRIFVDYLRNGRGATTVAPYSTRARAGAPVSTPLRWDELGSIAGPALFQVRNLRARLRTVKQDPWNGFFQVRQGISQGMLREAER